MPKTVWCFCAGDIDGLAPMLAPDLRFKGTLYQNASGGEYLKSLKYDPPGRCSYKILNITEGCDCASIYYEYENPDKLITIAQLFKIKNQQIS